MYEFWSDEDMRRARALYESGLSRAEVALELGRTKDAVASKLKAMGIRLSPEECLKRRSSGGTIARNKGYAKDRARDVASRADEIVFWHGIEEVARSIEARGRGWVAEIVRKNARYKPRSQ
jgi:hypothetical protein